MAPSNKPHASRREYYRILPAAPSELTETLVLTSAQNHFVDIRVKKDSSEGQFPGIQPLSQLDWAFAGISSSKLGPVRDGRQILRSKWEHWIDSNHAENPEKVVDEGEMSPSADGTTIERGVLKDPVTGEDMEMEECWVDLPLLPTVDGERVCCVVLAMRDEERAERGMVVRVGQFCQGIVRCGDALALERWGWREGDGWKRTVRMGDWWMPCGVAMEMERLEMGGTVRYGKQVWKVVEVSES